MKENTEPHEKIYKSRKAIFFNNLIGGVGWAVGATFGVAIILGVFGFIVSKLDLVPFVGSFVGDVTKFVLQKNPQLIR